MARRQPIPAAASKMERSNPKRLSERTLEPTAARRAPRLHQPEGGSRCSRSPRLKVSAEDSRRNEGEATDHPPEQPQAALGGRSCCLRIGGLEELQSLDVAANPEFAAQGQGEDEHKGGG